MPLYRVAVVTHSLRHGLRAKGQCGCVTASADQIASDYGHWWGTMSPSGYVCFVMGLHGRYEVHRLRQHDAFITARPMA